MSSEASTRVAIIGGGPAGLMAAERLAHAGCRVTVFERMPTVARKFLMAGRGGLNLTHSEDLAWFLPRYGDTDQRLVAAVRTFSPADVRAWADGLGQATFVGSSGRVFPEAMKSSPLLRAWLQRLGALGVEVRTRTRWAGFADDGGLAFIDEADGRAFSERFDATVLALGGASWPRLGADGSWVETLSGQGIAVAALEPANAGVLIDWSAHLTSRFAGQPLKRIVVHVGDHSRRGEAVITQQGLEGGAIYAVGAFVRAALASGPCPLSIDLRPDLDEDALAKRIANARGNESLSNTLRKAAGLDAAAIALFYEAQDRATAVPRDAHVLAALIKSVTFHVTGFSGMARAISSAGGVCFDELDARFMLIKKPGVFVAGEMLDWSAPTGGYLLQACLATGVAAADGVQAWLGSHRC